MTEAGFGYSDAAECGGFYFGVIECLNLPNSPAGMEK